jgi:mono/diheme cytochrome c family protein
MRIYYTRLRKKPFFFLFALTLLLSVNSVYGQPDGEKLFKANCAACHKPDKVLVGPALKGVKARWEGNEEMLYLWIKNPTKALESGNQQVQKLYDEWFPKAGIMTPQALNDEEIDAVLAYVDAYEPPVAATASSASGNQVTYVKQDDSWIWLAVLAAVLFAAILVLRSVVNVLQNAMQIEKGESPKAAVPVGKSITKWISNNKVFTFFAVLFVVIALFINLWGDIMGIGIYEGYKPEQPIAYSHEVHAGKLGIQCVYCHTGTLQSRTAMIPSANVCMNCHKAVAEGPITGTAEIQKIYDANGWDGSAYTGETHPIEWVKVHNLPDHVYFSHQQHYVVGKVDCVECHGDMTKETVGVQNAKLTMGWCLDCHNTRQVDLNSSAYYEEVHTRLLEHGEDELKKYLEDGKITVRELGGFECAKCHY